ncbi:MAG: heat-inducible transcriptional repressor HrcA [Dehalococcoidales bacterium]|nr:heat-inducible transcriptional repressor HrcA [Dehalococcoidales bacterium]
MSKMLSPRTETILKSIIEQYIARAAPVPSQSILHDYGLDVSSATIRNEMMHLKKEGYIIQPHTSAGSIPLDKGYRYYVETLDDIRLPINQQRMINHLFHQVETRLEEWARLTATLLANLSQNMAMVATAKPANCVFKHMELVSIQDSTALMVLVLQGAIVRQQLTVFDQTVPQEELSVVSNKLNAIFEGLSNPQIQAKKAGLIELENSITACILNIMKTEDEIEYEAPYLDGLQFIFNQPEFANARQTTTSLALTESKNLLRVILPDKLPGRGVHVFIGKENKSETIQNYSVVISQYGLPGEAMGCLAVIGPTRMHYARSIASVDYLAEVLSGLIAWLYGRRIPPEGN